MSYVGAMDSQRLAKARASMISEWKKYAETIGHPAGVVNFRPGTWWYLDRMPIREGYQTQSQDGKPVAPLLGKLTTYDGGITGINLYPSCFFVCCSDYVTLNCFVPLDVDHTQVELVWLVRNDAVEGVDYNPEKVSWLWRVTGEQDIKICENNQAGVNSRRYVPGPYSANEGLTEGFVLWYLEQTSKAPQQPAPDSET
jgi:Rieske 2Fe-2S family protein